jgi:hypothetical protein
MSKSNGALGAVGKVVTYILVVLLVLGIAGMVAYFALRSQGVTYYVEYGGERYFANGDGGSIELLNGKAYEFTVNSLTGGEVNYDVKVVSNSSNNFSFTCNGKIYQFVSTEEANNDYSEVFGLEKGADGFSLSFPDGFTVEQAVEEKFGGEVLFDEELQSDKSYFVISVTSEDSAVNLWFTFSGLTVMLNPPQIIF